MSNIENVQEQYKIFKKVIVGNFVLSYYRIMYNGRSYISVNVDARS